MDPFGTSSVASNLPGGVPKPYAATSAEVLAAGFASQAHRKDREASVTALDEAPLACPAAACLPLHPLQTVRTNMIISIDSATTVQL